MKRDIKSFRSIGLSLFMAAIFPLISFSQESNETTFENL
jgi:hypothetical protein